MRFFDPDSKVTELFASLGDMLLLNLCFLIGCLPVVTVGMSITAMYQVIGMRRRGQCSGIFRCFFSAWWENRRMGIGFWLFQAAGTGLLGWLLSTALLCYTGNPGLWGTVLFVGTFLLISMTGILTLVYPQLARFQNSWVEYFKNAAILAAAKAGWVVLMAALFLMPGLLLIFNQGLFLRTGFVWPTIGFSAIFYCASWLADHALKPLEKAAGQVKER